MAAPEEKLTEQVMRLCLSTTASEKLAQIAAETGRDVATVASELLELAINHPSLEELLSVSQAEFDATGKTKKEMMDFGRDLLDKVRSEKVSGK